MKLNVKDTINLILLIKMNYLKNIKKKNKLRGPHIQVKILILILKIDCQ